MSGDVKHCGGCERDLTVDDFHRNRRRKDGRSTQCKDCISARGKLWYANNRERHRANGDRWYADNLERVRGYNYRSKYGITVEQYDQLLGRQGGVCAICSKTETTKDKSGTLRRLAVDHCHDSGTVRGLLCYVCNHTLARLGDSAESARRFMDYLEGPWPELR